MAAIDADYERVTAKAEWKLVYNWEIRCYQWMNLSRLMFGGRVPPVNGDELLQPERLPVENEAAARASYKAATTLRRQTEQRVYDCLAEHGPLMAADIAARAGMAKKTVLAALERRPNLFVNQGRVGRNRVWYIKAGGNG